MEPVYQSASGSSFRAWLASVLELPLEEVPDFCSTTDSVSSWYTAINLWLNKFNLAYITIPHVDRVFEGCGVVGLHHEITGTDEWGEYTTGVGVDGKVVHTVSTERNLNYLDNAWGVLICLNPALQKRL